MEIIARIEEQLPLHIDEYTDRNGQPQRLAKVGLKLGIARL